MKRITSFAVAIVLGLAVSAQAAVMDVQVVQVDNSAGGAALDGFVTNDVLITFDGQYTGAQILLEGLSDGDIFQQQFGSVIPPNPGFFGAFPDLEFDTFVAQGSPTAGGPFGEPAPGGGAVDLGADAGATFDTARLNQAFNPAGGQDVFDQTDFLIARITLRDTVNGSSLLLASAGGERISLEGSVVDGGLSFAPDVIPEPTSILLGALGMLGMASIRRRS